VTAAPPRIRFGFDVLDALEWGWWPPFGYDVIDVLESREHDIPTRCTQCNDAWLTGPQALAAGKCWRCRTSGDAA
jgi:hypothetical protein